MTTRTPLSRRCSARTGGDAHRRRRARDPVAAHARSPAWCRSRPRAAERPARGRARHGRYGLRSHQTGGAYQKESGTGAPPSRLGCTLPEHETPGVLAGAGGRGRWARVRARAGRRGARGTEPGLRSAARRADRRQRARDPGRPRPRDRRRAAGRSARGAAGGTRRRDHARRDRRRGADRRARSRLDRPRPRRVAARSPDRARFSGVVPGQLRRAARRLLRRQPLPVAARRLPAAAERTGRHRPPRPADRARHPAPQRRLGSVGAAAWTRASSRFPRWAFTSPPRASASSGCHARRRGPRRSRWRSRRATTARAPR